MDLSKMLGTGFLILRQTAVMSLKKLLLIGRHRNKSVFRISDKASSKPVSSATETTQKNEILLVASLDMLLSKTRITKALIRLHGCAGWSAPVLFANPSRQVFSRQGPNKACFTCSRSRESNFELEAQRLCVQHIIFQGTWPRGYKTFFSCSSQQIIKFQLLVKFKILKNKDFSCFKSLTMLNLSPEFSLLIKVNSEQNKFHAQLSRA